MKICHADNLEVVKSERLGWQSNQNTGLTTLFSPQAAITVHFILDKCM